MKLTEKQRKIIEKDIESMENEIGDVTGAIGCCHAPKGMCRKEDLYSIAFKAACENIDIEKVINVIDLSTGKVKQINDLANKNYEYLTNLTKQEEKDNDK